MKSRIPSLLVLFLALMVNIHSPIRHNFFHLLPTTLSEMMGQIRLLHSLGSWYLTVNSVWPSLLRLHQCLPEIWSGTTEILTTCKFPYMLRPDLSFFPVAKWISQDTQALRALNFRGLRERDTGLRVRLSDVIFSLQNYLEHPFSGPQNPALHLSSVMPST